MYRVVYGLGFREGWVREIYEVLGRSFCDKGVGEFSFGFCIIFILVFFL